MNLKVIFSILIFVLFTGCSVDKKSETPTTSITAATAENPKRTGLPLASQWILESFHNNNINNSGQSPYININNNLKIFTGNGGCNAINGVITVMNDTIKLEKIMTTRMACENLRVENLFIQNLKKATKYNIVGGELFLYESDNLLMTLESFR